MIIPPKELDEETLCSIVEDFITREGTDYGEQEMSLQDKVHGLRAQVVRGDVVIVFDEKSQSVNLLSKDDVL